MRKQLYTKDELEIMRVQHNEGIFAGMDMQSVNPNDCSGCNYINNPLYKASKDMLEALLDLHQVCQQIPFPLDIKPNSLVLAMGKAARAIQKASEGRPHHERI